MQQAHPSWRFACEYYEQRRWLACRRGALWEAAKRDRLSVPLTVRWYHGTAVDVLLGNRVPADVELAGLDLPEMGAPGYPDFVISPGGAEGVAPLMAPVTAAPSPATLHPATVK